MTENRIVSLTLDLPSTSREDAVRQFISAVGIYGMGGFDFQVFEDDDEMTMVNGRDAMRATMEQIDPDPDERQEVKEDEVRSDLLNDVEDDAVWPEWETEGEEE